MEQSILKSTKQILGIADSYDVFDLDIITHINTAFSTLTQLGIGPYPGFMIQDETETWDQFIDTATDPQYSAIRSYVFLKVRSLFDPPTTSYLITATERQISELEWRLNVHREETQWIDPDPDPVIEDDPDSAIEAA